MNLIANKIWVDKGGKFFNKSIKLWLEKNAMEMYSTHKEGKSVVAERTIRTLKNKIFKYMTSISNYVYIDKLDDLVNKYDNTYHSTIKMNLVDVKSNTYFNSSKETNDEDPKLKIADIVRILKNKKVFAKDYIPNWSEEVFVITKVKNTVLWTYVISDPKGERMFGRKRIAKNK